ncbi:MAG: asparagine synthase (glutamine-hydrolyzing) [Candidatus Krumholzibacteriia bacterium]
MCGICGMYAPGDVDPGVLRRMNDTIAHRGPDDEGYYTDERVGLASRRLSIIDLARGRMPIHNEDEGVWVVFNGEIYNFPELRHALEAKGHQFLTHTDTEVLVHLYEERGEQLFEDLRGMFAVALWDRQHDIILLGRDRVGKKPLYYSWDGRRLFFASEIKALREVPERNWSLDWQALNDFFSYLYIPDPLSIYKEVRKLPAAHYLKLHAGHLEVRPYWDLQFANVHTETDPRWYVDELRARVTDAVRARLVSDVPLGAFLSGGVDSATIVGLMSRILDEPVKTFSIGFDEETFDELKYARIAARAFGTDHHEEILRPRAVDLVEKLIEHFDEPFGDPSALPTYMVSQVARRHVTVVLSGDGGDEAFAGYDSHAVHERDERFHRHVPEPLRSLACAGLDLGARLTGHAKLRRMAGAVRRAHRPLEERYCHVFDKLGRRRLFSREALSQIGLMREAELFEAHARAQKFPDFLSKILYLDTKTYLAHDVLAKVDRMSMANSLEVRSPLVDHHVLEFVAGIPSTLKLHNGTSKYIFKKMAEEFVPHEIVYRRKHGFGVPIRSWFRKDLRETLHDHLLSSDDGGQRFFNQGFVEHMLREHEAGRWDWSVQLWPLLVFRMWYRRYGP